MSKHKPTIQIFKKYNIRREKLINSQKTTGFSEAWNLNQAMQVLLLESNGV